MYLWLASVTTDVTVGPISTSERVSIKNSASSSMGGIGGIEDRYREALLLVDGSVSKSRLRSAGPVKSSPSLLRQAVAGGLSSGLPTSVCVPPS